MGIYEQLRNRIFKREADGSFPLWKAVAGEFEGTISLRLWCSSRDVPALHKPFLLVPVPLSLPYLIASTAGMSSGALAQLLASPTDLVKASLQKTPCVVTCVRHFACIAWGASLGCISGRVATRLILQ